MGNKFKWDKINKLKRMEERGSYHFNDEPEPYYEDDEEIPINFSRVAPIMSKNQPNTNKLLIKGKLGYKKCPHCRTVVPIVELEQHIKTEHSEQ